MEVIIRPTADEAAELTSRIIKKSVLEKPDLVLGLATGGTMEATCKLVEKMGARIAQISFIIELDFLNGRDKIKNYDVQSLIHYDG